MLQQRMPDIQEDTIPDHSTRMQRGSRTMQYGYITLKIGEIAIEKTILHNYIIMRQVTHHLVDKKVDQR